VASDGRVFRYSLQALMRKRQSELDTRKGELATAKLRVTEQTRELEGRAAELRELEDYQRALSTDGALIDVNARMRLHHCLSHAVSRKQRQVAQLAQAREQEEKILEQLRAAREALQTVERHRERSAGQFDAEGLRKTQLTMDELYLLRRST
jgi:hypothetical protein